MFYSFLDEIQLLRDFSLRSLYWSFSSLIFPLTKCLIVPSCLRTMLLVNDQNNLEVCFFNQEEDSAQIGSFLEVVAINPDFYKSLKQLENVEYNALLVQTIQVTKCGQQLSAFELLKFHFFRLSPKHEQAMS